MYLRGSRFDAAQNSRINHLSFPFISRSKHSQAAQRAHDLHQSPTGRAGGTLRQDTLPGHLHARGGGPKDQPAWIQSAGKYSV